MNIPDKERLCTEAQRVLRRGGVFAIYDVMRVGEGDLDFPVPWAATPETRSEAPTSELQSLMRISYAVFCLRKTTTDRQSKRLKQTHECEDRLQTTHCKQQ